ncbi:hypothetical protein Cpir12675_001224 [Ceratocystis pirilliformis]|uniref:Imitation switch two complex protein 1 n=1 Tax=Ceratocystis pirilliformis TaxID=259994 RepID=A0ABR3ZG82_9PEZI
MVLYKRKPVVIPPPSADIRDDNAEVGMACPADWRDLCYLRRLLKSRKFICQITGQSKLTFFEALKSEKAGAKEVQQAFPESLKGPVLRRVQFQTISRIDHLVDNIYDEFKCEFFPGETVTAQITNTEKVQGTIREKIRVGPKLQSDGTMSQPFSRYVINIEDRENQEAVVDGPAVMRDRKIFTKAVLRTFIKNAVSREAWNGAPWVVKHEFADSYHIDTRIPQHLRYDHKVMQRKQLQAAKRTNHPMESNGFEDIHGLNPRHNMHHEPARLPDLKPKSHKMRPQLIANPMTFQSPASYEPTYVTIPPPSANYLSISLRNNNPPPLRKAQSPPPPVLPKYPIDDLDVGLRAGVVRPKLRFVCGDHPSAAPDDSYPYWSQLKMSSIGYLLETWDTLNVYCEIFKLDSFTFDDYVEALCITSLDTKPQLIEEIHCSVLKILVGSKADGGRVEFALPAEEEEDEEEDEEDSTMQISEPEEKPLGRATRSSMAKIEADRIAAEAAAAEKEAKQPELTNRASELLQDFDWIESLQKRQFQGGGWQRIIVGLLNQLSRNERKTKACEEILAELVPDAVEPTQETVVEQYATLDVNTKIRILQILCMLTTETKAVRGYMEDCSETMTQYRKEKIDWQRQRKQAIEDLKGLNEQRKVMLPDNMPPSPATDMDDSKMTDVDNSHVDEAENESDDDRSPVPNSRKAAKRDDKKKKLKKEETPATKTHKQSKQFIKLLKDIQKKEDAIKECEKEIAVIDNDLREADCPRTRVLGKDRFWNRYYWFERNGMPYGGLPDSSTASAAYANGCIWVQGPDDMEREGFIDLPTDLQNEYKARFNMTVTERKAREESDTSVFNANQWGYICEPDDLDKLIHYLDPRGINELKLRKELVTFRERIITNMKNRKIYLGIPDEPKDKEDADDGVKEDKDHKVENADTTTGPPSPAVSNATNNDDDGSKRNGKRSMRLKRQSQPQPPAPEDDVMTNKSEDTPMPQPLRCLKWENTVAIEEFGHLHSEPPPPPPPPPKRRANNKKRESTAVTEVDEPPRKTRRR